MKRTGNIWEKVVSLENIYNAYRKVLRGKRSKPGMGDFFTNLEENLLSIRAELIDYTYKPGQYKTFWIKEPKSRMISAAPIRDRIVHHSLVNIIEPIFEKNFIFHSYACRAGKGNHKAMTQFVRWSRSEKYVLKLDIHKFFPTIDHEILKSLIRRKIKDRNVLWLCDLIIDSSNPQEEIIQYFPGDDLLSPLGRRKGLPIGNLTSQFFANIYLNPLDHFIKDNLRIRRYIRYVDDFCCFHNDKHFLRDIRAIIIEMLADLRLTINDKKSRIRQIKEGIEFLGFVISPKAIRLNQTAVRRQRRRIKDLRSNYNEGKMSWRKASESLQAWNAHSKHGTTYMLRKDVFYKSIFIRQRN